ncbi:Glucuronoxylan 4-O-methyltransferase 1 [Apostasia shenzhenica]|uniref:Glucuronoxylan 4-O-methyltransferase 1 n=1 Tax=Apostasia shenzhenica TaxID=1088818 RepID=A0A2I0ANN8_9ASPA|nr:Glucuronoxylan 4-O-methyltransferase 1 [Apostasia shenzhenica]
MKQKVHSSFTLKRLLLSFLLIAVALLALRSSLSSSPATSAGAINACAKLPPSLSNTIVHYATSNVTPQQTFAEISVTARVLRRRSPCNFLVFGLGHDSPMWSSLNYGGRTVFLEEDQAWMQKMRSKFPELEAYHATYKTKVRDAEELLKLRSMKECTAIGDIRGSKCRLALRDLPEVFFEVEWEMIMVDAPTGYFAEAPGRMAAIYTAGMAARGRREGETDIFVHDVDRTVEDEFSKSFLCEGFLKEEEGRLRHFIIPSYRDVTGNGLLPFCP